MMSDKEYQAWLDGARAYNDGERLNDYVFQDAAIKNAFYDGYHRCSALDALAKLDQELELDND